VNIKEYISSGIIESYVLGLVSDAERTEFEAYCVQYPEIAAARNAFEVALEDQLLRDAVAPSPQLRQQIQEKLANISAVPAIDSTEESGTPVRRMGAWRWLAAASLILLAVVSYMLVNSHNKYNELAAENHSLRNQLEQSSNQLAAMQQDAQTLQSPGLKMAALKGTPHAPQALATIYWDTASNRKDVYLMINNLPQPPTDKQYQLWALLDGKPIDLGVFDMNVRQSHLLVKMQNVQKAQAFAITLEPRGGSSNPTMEAMYVQGAL